MKDLGNQVGHQHLHYIPVIGPCAPASQAKLALFHLFTAQTCYLGLLEVGPQPKHGILAPDFPLFESQGKFPPITFFHGPIMPSWPPRSWPLARANNLGRGLLPLRGGGYANAGDVSTFKYPVTSLVKVACMREGLRGCVCG